ATGVPASAPVHGAGAEGAAGAGLKGNGGLGCSGTDAAERGDTLEVGGREASEEVEVVSGVAVPETSWVWGPANCRRSGRLERNSKRMDPRQITMTGIITIRRGFSSGAVCEVERVMPYCY